MTHFLTLVLVPDGTRGVEKAVSGLLAPYDVSWGIDEYSDKCHCIVRRAHAKLQEEVAGHFGTEDQLRDRLEVTHFPSEASYSQQAWNKLIKDFSEFCETRRRKLIHSVSPDNDCLRCHGTGLADWVDHPRSRLDWWQIGGRFSGILTGYDPSKIQGTSKRVLLAGVQARKTTMSVMPAMNAVSATGRGKAYKCRCFGCHTPETYCK